MAGSAGIRDLVFVRHLGSNEAESVCMDECIRRAFGLDLWHVTSNALASWRALLVMRVLFERCSARPVRRKRPVTI